MSYSLQTNVDSIQAQENLSVNQQFQSRTIQRLTSGYRINSSSDDAAGLAVANKFRSDTTELTQGIRNANDGISTLEIVDGGLNNISTMLDRLKTLATESASGTFSGSRSTLNTEYQSLLKEIDRQASNVGLSTGTVGGRYNSTAIDVYTGGGEGVQSNSKVTVNLTGARVDSQGLGLLSTNILGDAGTSVDTTTNLNTGVFVANGSQDFTFETSAGTTKVTIKDTGTTGLTGEQVVDQFNTQLQGTGVSAQIGTTGKLEFVSDQAAFSVTTNDTGVAGTAIAVTGGAAKTASNSNMYDLAAGIDLSGGAVAANAGTYTITANGNTYSATITNGDSLATVLKNFNSAFNGAGVYAITDPTGKKIELQGTSSFSMATTAATTVLSGTTPTTPTSTASSPTQNALNALNAITQAVLDLGNVQGKVGTGQNQLQYAISLAQSQVTSFSAAESRIRDADVAAEAANLTKAQVLQQSSIAALAQANQAPQAVLSLLKG